MSTIDFENIKPQKVSLFGHHPDPIVDWEVEVECLESGKLDRELGLAESDDPESYGWLMLVSRIGPALQFGANLPRDEGNVAANYLKLKAIDQWLVDNRWRRTPPMILNVSNDGEVKLEGIPENIRMQQDSTNRLYRHGQEETPPIVVQMATEEDIIRVLQNKRRIVDEELVAMEAKRKVGEWEKFNNWLRGDEPASVAVLGIAFFFGLVIGSALGLMAK